MNKPLYIVFALFAILHIAEAEDEKEKEIDQAIHAYFGHHVSWSGPITIEEIEKRSDGLRVEKDRTDWKEFKERKKKGDRIYTLITDNELHWKEGMAVVGYLLVREKEGCILLFDDASLEMNKEIEQDTLGNSVKAPPPLRSYV